MATSFQYSSLPEMHVKLEFKNKMYNQNIKQRDIRCFNSISSPSRYCFFFILHLFYLSSCTDRICFAMFHHWPRYSYLVPDSCWATTRIYFAFFRGIHLLCWYMFIINATRSCNERTILHCIESYLYYIILVNKKNIFWGGKRGKK
jgi:hypothetical protein